MRESTREQADQHRDGGRKCERCAVDTNRIHPRQLRGGERNQSANTERGRANGECASGRGEQNALDQHEPDETRTPSAQCHPHHEFAATSCAAGEQKIWLTFTLAMTRSRTTAPRTARSDGLTALVISVPSGVTTNLDASSVGRGTPLVQHRVTDLVNLPARRFRRDAIPQTADRTQVVAPRSAK